MPGVTPEEDQPSETSTKRGSALSDAAPLLMTLAAGLICFGLFYNRGLGLSVIGYSIAPAERVLQGEVPYRDFLFNYTPGILWVNALLMKMFGATLLATRIGLLAFKLFTLFTLFHLARRLTNRWAALAPVALTLAWLGYQQVFNVYPDQYLMVFALVGLICMLNYDDTGSARWLLLCGLAAGAVFLFKHNVGILLIASGALAAAARELMTAGRIKGAAKAVAIYVGGFAVIAAAFAAYLIYNRALGAMVTHFLHHAAEYSEARSVGLPSPAAAAPAAMVLVPIILVGGLVLLAFGRAFQYYLLATIVFGSVMFVQATRGDAFNDALLTLVAYFPPAVLIAASALALWRLKRTQQAPVDWWRNNGAMTITGLFALAVYLEVFPRADYFHLVRVLPPVFLFFCALLARSLPVLTGSLSAMMQSPRRSALLLLSAPIVFLAVIGINNTWAPEFDSDLRFRDRHELNIERGRGVFVEERQAELTEGLVGLIQANSSKDDYIFSFAQRGSALYFLADRRNPTRFLWWRSVGISAEEREGVMTMIANRRARLIVVQDVAANKEIQDFISDNYDQIGTVADIAVYGLKNLPEADR